LEIIRLKIIPRHKVIASLLVTTIVAVVACNQDVTTPRDGVSNQHEVSGSTASRNTVDSPDLTTITMTGPEADHGTASTTVNVTYPYRTIVNVRATGVINKTANQHLNWFYAAHPSGTQSFFPAGDATLVWMYQGTGGGYSPTATSSSDSSGSGYIALEAGTTLTTGQRNYKANEVASGECGPSNCYIYCGGFYPPNCFTFSGNAGAITVQRASANMVLTVDSTTVSTGSSVTFFVRPDVATISGLTTPYQIDTAAWTPDPDSLGGDYTEARTSGACTISGGNCTRTMVGSGSMRIVAQVADSAQVQ
jgi:hypothetical protein